MLNDAIIEENPSISVREYQLENANLKREVSHLSSEIEHLKRQLQWFQTIQAGIVLEVNATDIYGQIASLAPFTIILVLGTLTATGLVLSLGINRIIKPLRSLSEITRKFAEGDSKARKTKFGLLEGDRSVTSRIANFLPGADQATGALLARAALPNRDGFWRPGMRVRGVVTIQSRQVPLAVRTEALQAFRDFTVVFAQVGNTYEVRMLELGTRGPEWTEVLGGIKPGQAYVTAGSYVIKADIEKAGASHDH